MRINRKRAFSLLTLCVLLLGCAQPTSPSVPAAPAPSGASPGNQPAPAQPGAKKQIAVAIAGEPRTLSDTINQANSGGVAGVAEVEALITGTMVYRHGETGALLPMLAEQPPTLENGLWKLTPEGRMETVHRIRPNAQWHDGTPITAEDLAFTARVAQDSEVPSLAHVGFRSVDRVEVTDPRTVTVFWKRPYIEADLMFSERLGVPLPKHLLEQVYLEDKANFTNAPYWTEKFVGNGPFKIRDYQTGSHMIVMANEQFVLGRPKLDEITVRFIQDANALIANLLAGQVELTLGRRLSVEQGIEVSKQWQQGQMQVSGQNWLALYPQFVNPNPPVIANLQFRRALLHATDRQQLVDILTQGLSSVAHSMVSPSQPEYRGVESSIMRYDFDPRRAAQLIEGLGYSKGPDGLYVDGSGQKLNVENRTTAGDDFRDKMLFSITNDWRTVGVDAETYIVPRQRADDREFRATRPAFELVRQPNDPSRYTSSETPLPSNGFRGQNRTRYQSPELDSLIDRYYTTIPREERSRTLAQIVSHITDQVVMMGMIFNVEPIMVSNRLVNVNVAKPDGVRDSWNSWEWDLK
jgi:peptide/nickel transport system substrate-binding protein